MKLKFLILMLVIFIAAVSIYINIESRQSKNDITLYGNVDVRQVDLGFRIPGKVEVLYFEEGDFISSNILVAQLNKQPYFDQVKEAEARVESAKASLCNAESILTRRQELILDGSISKEDFDNALSSKAIQIAALKEAEAALGIAKSNLSYTEIFSPSEGTILTRIREVGSVVNTGEPVYTLSITSPMWIRAFCTEPELGLIYPGMEAKVFTDTPGGTPYLGKVGFISPVAEFTPKTVETTQLRTDLVYRLRIYIENPDLRLRQGMPVTVKLYPDLSQRKS